MPSTLMLNEPPNFLEEFAKLGKLSRIASHSTRRGAKRNAVAAEVFTGLGDSFRRIAASHGYDLPLPQVPKAGMALGLGSGEAQSSVHQAGWLRYAEELHGVLLACPAFGVIEIMERDARFTYSETTRRMGVLQHRYTRTEHEHWLTGVFRRSLSSPQVNLPRGQRRIVGMFPPVAQERMQVFTGLLVQMDVKDAGTIRKDHIVGKTLKSAGRLARNHGPTAVAGVATVGAVAGIAAGIGSLIASGIAAASAVPVGAAVVGTAAVIAVADPAVCFGDIVVTGYLEPSEELE